MNIQTCEKCGELQIDMNETPLCSCGSFVTAKLEDLAVVYDFRMPHAETIASAPFILPDPAGPGYHRLDKPDGDPNP